MSFKYILISLFAICMMMACTETEKQEEKTDAVNMSFHGDQITPDDAVPLIGFSAAEKQEGVKLSGTIDKVCQNKGCWMTLDTGDGNTMRVTFKDYGFFVPKDAGRKTAIIQGTVAMDTTSVEDLRHYAEDGGMSAEEAASTYTEPEVAMSFVASGVIIK